MRILPANLFERLQGAIVIAIGFLYGSLEKPRPAQSRRQFQRLGDVWFGRLGFALLDQRARHVEPAIGIAWLSFGDVPEGIFRAFQVALQQQADAPIVPTLAI